MEGGLHQFVRCLHSDGWSLCFGLVGRRLFLGFRLLQRLLSLCLLGLVGELVDLGA